MATVDEKGIAALVYDFLLKKDASLAQVFQKKTKAVSRIFVYTTSFVRYSMP